MDDGVREVTQSDGVLFGKGQWDTQLQTMGKCKNAAGRKIRGSITCSNDLRGTHNFMLSSLVVDSEIGNAAGSMISARRNGRVYSVDRGGVT